MPHVADVEAAAEQIARLGATVDAAIVDHIVDGTRLPTLAALLDRALPEVSGAVVASFADITNDYNQLEVDTEVAAIMAELASMWSRALRDAQAKRLEVESAPPLDDTESDRLLVAAGAGFGALVSVAVRQGRSVDRGGLQRLAATAGVRMPRSTAGGARQIVRTRVAEGRNRLAANVAERAGLVVRVEDARFGPTDKDCEDVNGRFATPEWLRRHPTEHPNCTRRGRPARLPVGRYVTLLE